MFSAMADESIYSWIREDVPAREKAPRYVSKHDPTAPVSSTIRAPKKAAATMGRHVKDTIDTTAFLRSKERTAELPPPEG